ncbi:ABC transporter substrate-binding protein [Variovorax sp. N23]|uniref:ABC transporter substrate-binding protein n=1 Tax=Variovorax sp. N23 TaxID=2980555 RepID=UPI0021C91863|nr:ABC transporter substrate-binding protein [Variovorax sp. N23]MCU4120694.1 ABC transporter substrate-binding protein [Variovorax sp. N23]
MSLFLRRPSALARLMPALAVVAGLLACVGGAAAQPAKPLVKVRYEEVIRSVLYVPMYVALDQGYFRDAGLDVGMKTSQGTDKGMAALLSGSADIVLIGPEASIYVANSESPTKPKIFAGLTATDGFLLMARKPVTGPFDWNQLKGKSVMAFRPGSNPDVFLEAALRKHGLDPKKDLKLVNNIGPAARTGAWMAGQNDYAIFLEPEAGNLEKDGNGYVMASIGSEVGPVDYTVFTTTDTFMQKSPEVLQAWTNAVARAQKYVQSAPAADLARQIAAYFPGMSQPELVKAIDRYRGYKLWKTSPLVEKAAVEQLQDMLTASGVLESAKRVKYEQVVVTDFATKAK